MNQKEITEQLQCAVALHIQGKLDQAEAIYSQVLATDINNFDALNLCGCIYGEKKRFDDGIYLLRRAVSLQPDNPNAIYNLGNILKACEQWDEAISCYERTLSLKFENPSAMNNLGICLMKVERYEQSVIVLKHAVSLQPGFAGAWLNLGNAFKEQKKLDESITSLRKAIECNPNFADAYFNLANVLNEKGEVEQAITSLRTAIECNPNFADAYFNLANVINERGEAEDAIANYRKAINLQPLHAAAICNLGSILCEFGEFDEGISLLKQSLQIDPHSSLASFALARSLADNADFVDARKIVLQAFSLDPAIVGAVRDVFKVLRAEFDFSTAHKSIFLGLVAEIKSSLSVNTIACFGDSHVSLFEGINGFEVYRVGAATAFNLMNPKSSSNAREKILEVLRNKSPKGTAVLLSFGELDIRVHIVKSALNKGLSLDTACENTVDAYIQFCREIAHDGYKVVIYGPYGSGVHSSISGSKSERYYASLKIDQLLRSKSKKEGFIFFSMQNLLINHLSLDFGRGFFEDGLHFPGHRVRGNISREIKCVALSYFLNAINDFECSAVPRQIPVKSVCSAIDDNCSYVIDILDPGAASFNLVNISSSRSIDLALIFRSSLNSFAIDLGSFRKLCSCKLGFEVALGFEELQAWEALVFDETLVPTKLIEREALKETKNVEFNVDLLKPIRYLIFTFPTSGAKHLSEFEILVHSHIVEEQEL